MENRASHKDDKNLDESFIEVFLMSTQYNYVNLYINFSLFFIESFDFFWFCRFTNVVTLDDVTAVAYK